jgi:hypothetical protein
MNIIQKEEFGKTKNVMVWDGVKYIIESIDGSSSTWRSLFHFISALCMEWKIKCYHFYCRTSELILLWSQTM